MKNLIARVKATADALDSTRPILRRELLGLLRSRMAFRVTLITVGVVSLIPLLNWPRSGEIVAFDRAGRLFTAYKWSFIAALLLFVPAVTAGSISDEREAGTYDLLHASRIRPAGIVLGKLLSRTTFFLLLFAFTFPLVLILYLLGGFEFSEFFLTALQIVVLTIFLGVIGLWSSVRHSKTSRAIGEAFMLSLALLFINQALGNVLGKLLTAFLPAWFHPDTILALSYCAVYVIVGSLLFISLLGWARIPDLAVIRAKVEGRPVGKKVKVRPNEAKGWLARRFLKETGEGIPDGWNPVFVASLRDDDAGMARTYRMFFAIVVGLTTLILFVALINTSRENFAQNFALFNWGYGVAIVIGIALILPSLSTWSLAYELQRQRLDALCSTPLRPRELLLGKLFTTYVNSFGLLMTALVVRGLEGIGALLVNPPAFLLALASTLAFVASFVVVAAVASTAGFLAASMLGRRVHTIVVANLIAAGYLVGAPLLADVLYGSDVEWFISPLYTLLYGARWVDFSGFPVSLTVSLTVAAVVALGQFYLAAEIFRKRWLRER